jgi:hypothetical protein
MIQINFVLAVVIGTLNRHHEFRFPFVSISVHPWLNASVAAPRWPFSSAAVRLNAQTRTSPKNITLISKHLQKFAKIFFGRRRHFCSLNHLDFCRKLLWFNNFPPNGFLLLIFL